jgi:hypothetical protein
MTLTINDTTMTSDQTPHTARLAPCRPHHWEVSWLPGQILDRNTAITAMILADTAAQADLHEGHRLWPHIQGWAAELGLTGPDAIAQVSQPPHDLDPGQDRGSGQPGGGRLTSQLATASRSPRSTGRTGRPPEGRTPAPQGTADQEEFYPGCLRASPQIRPAPEPELEAGL